MSLLWAWARKRPVVARLGAIVAFFLLWELVARTIGDPLFMAAPSEVFAALGTIYTDVDVMHAIWTTLWELGLAFGLSVAVGLLVGVPIGLHRASNESLFPIVMLLYGVPQITILPLIVLYFGIGPESRVVFGFTHGVFPMIVSIVAGVQSFSPLLAISANSMGASNAQVFRHVVFPQMVPTFFTGMRLGMSAVLLGVLLAELYSSQGGIGQFTAAYTQTFQPANLFALIATLAAMAIVMNEAVRRGEIRSSRWRR
jgi:ABC-type nitrate/sulfonate/bicarbonate transport system permease component